MFFHKDLNLYLNKNFRSFDYLKSVWQIIEFDLIYIIGMLNQGNISISLESDCIQMTATTNFNNIFKKSYDMNFSHSLILCYDFVSEITITINNSKEPFYFDALNCKFYYDKKFKNDEGFIECSISSNVKVSSLDKFKKSLLPLLSKELQFVINKNVFQLDIEKKDLIESDIDAAFEYTTAYSEMENIMFMTALKKINFVREDKELLMQLKKQLQKNINV